MFRLADEPQSVKDEASRAVDQALATVGQLRRHGRLDGFAGTDDDVVASARYALHQGMPGGGYVFATSNCIYTGMRLRRYELMLDVWRREGHYPA